MDESETQMTDAQAVEQGILRAVGKLLVIGLFIGVVLAIGYGIVTHRDPDEVGQEQLIHDLGGVR